MRNAVARFDQVEDVSDADRELAFANIKQAAKHYEVELTDESWQDLGVRPRSGRAKAAATAGTRRRNS